MGASSVHAVVGVGTVHENAVDHAFDLARPPRLVNRKYRIVGVRQQQALAQFSREKIAQLSPLFLAKRSSYY